MQRASSICCQRTGGVKVFSLHRFDCIRAQKFLSSCSCEWPWEVAAISISSEMTFVSVWRATFVCSLHFSTQFDFPFKTVICLQRSDSASQAPVCEAHVYGDKPKRSLNAMQILVFLWLCIKSTCISSFTKIKYRKSPIEMIWKCFFQCKKTSLSLVIYS